MSLVLGAPLVLVVTGTDKHPFDRLVSWADEWLLQRTGSAVRCVVQHGTSHVPGVAEGARLLDHAELGDLMRDSAVIITHGGPTTISEARRLGHVPLVVPRRSAWGEHVDDHQVRFTDRLSRSGLIDLVEPGPELATAVEQRLHQRVPEQRDPSDRAPARVGAAADFADVIDDLLATRKRRRRRGAPTAPTAPPGQQSLHLRD